MSEHDTYEATCKLVSELAKDAFKDHELVPTAQSEWVCRRPGTNCYSFKLILRPGAVIIWGDLGEWILRHAEFNSFAWLKGAVNSPEYVISKIMAGDKYSFYQEDAKKELNRLLKEDDEDGKASEVKEALADEWFDAHEWHRVWAEVGDIDPYGAMHPSSSALWMVECLKKFLELNARPWTEDGKQ